MSLYVESADYSPLYNALAQRKNARLTLLEKKSQRSSDILAIAEAGISIAQQIYSIAEKKRLAQAKLQLQEYTQRMKKEARDAVLNNDYTLEDITFGTNTEGGAGEEAGIGAPTGKKTIKLPESFEETYRQAVEAIKKDYQGFGDIESWALDQLYSAYDNAKGVALETFYQQELKDTAALEKTIITNALDLSVQEGDFKYVKAAVESATSLSDTAKQGLLLEMETAYKYGAKGNQVKATTALEGYDAAVKMIDEWAESGEVTAEQAEALKKNAAVVAQETTAAVQQQAETTFQKAIENGQDLDSALEVALANVPAPYRAGTENLIRSQYRAKIETEDYEADREMREVWDKYANRPDLVFRALRDTKDKEGKNYADRMTTDTYAWWYDRFAPVDQGEPAAVDEDAICPPEVERELRDIISDNVRYPTNEDKIDAVNKIARRKNADGSFTVGLKVIKDYRTQASDPDVLDSFISGAIKRVGDYYERLAGKEKPGSAEERALLQAGMTARTNLIAWWKKGQRTEQQTNAYVLSLMNPTKPKPLYEDQARLERGGTAYDKRRAEISGSKYPGEMPMAGRAILTDDEKIAFEEGDRRILEQDYGISADDIVQSEELENGLSKFRVVGINPERPDATYWVTFTDNGKGNEQLWIQDSKTGNWLKGDTIPTAKQKQAAADKAAAAAAAAAEAERKRELEQAVAANEKDAKTLLRIAKETGGATAVQDASDIASKDEPEPNSVQLDQIESALLKIEVSRGKTLRTSDIEAIFKGLHGDISQAKIMRIAADRGWTIEK